MRTILATIAALVLAGATGAAVFIASGLYDISATDQHLPPTYWAIEKAMQRSVARRAANIPVPALDSPAQLARGRALYRIHCVQCHGAPGTAPEPFALGLTPLPAPLVQTGRDWTPAQIFWVVKYGIKMTGMPAWIFRFNDEDIWAIVAFVRQLPSYSPQAYRALPDEPPAAASVAAAGEPDPDRGRNALQQYACIACHRIPGMTGAEALVGPPLDGIAARGYLGGILPNTPENLVRWIRSPQSVSPLTAMPDLGVSERDARDMAAHLRTLK